jgi:hypothetical protein
MNLRHMAEVHAPRRVQDRSDAVQRPPGRQHDRAVHQVDELMELAPRAVLVFLTHALERLLATARRVPEPLIDVRPFGDETNSIGSLVIHSCGVVDHWLGHVALGEPSTRDRDAEFSATATITEIEQLVATTLERAVARLERLDAASTAHVARRPALYGGDRSDAAVVLHVLEECFQHLGHAELTVDALTVGGVR